MNFKDVLNDCLKQHDYPGAFGYLQPKTEAEKLGYLEAVNNILEEWFEKKLFELTEHKGKFTFHVNWKQGYAERAIICEIFQNYYKLNAKKTEPGYNSFLGYTETTKYPSIRLESNDIGDISPIPQNPLNIEELKRELAPPPAPDLTKGIQYRPPSGMQKVINDDRLKGKDSQLANIEFCWVSDEEHNGKPQILAQTYAHTSVIAEFLKLQKNLLGESESTPEEQQGRRVVPFNSQNPVTLSTLNSLLEYIYIGTIPEFKDIRDVESMLMTLAFLEANPESDEIKQLNVHCLVALKAQVTAEHLVPFLTLATCHPLDGLRQLCLSQVPSLINNPQVAEATLKFAEEKKDRQLLDAVAFYVLQNQAPGLSAENLVRLAQIAFSLNDDNAAAVATYALRKKLISDRAEFDQILSFAHAYRVKSIHIYHLYEFCKFFARQAPELLATFKANNTFEAVSHLTVVQIKVLAQQAEGMRCNEVRFICAEAMASKVTAENYSDVVKFCQSHSQALKNEALFKQCQDIIQLTNKKAIGRLAMKATEQEVIQFVEAAATVEAWDRVGTGLLRLAQRGWGEKDFFARFEDKKGLHNNIKLACEFREANENDSGVESE